VRLSRSTVLKIAMAALAAIAIFLALDSMITGPAKIDSYRRSADDRHVTVSLILAPIDAVIGQSLREEPNRIVVSVRIRRPPAITTSFAVFSQVTFDLGDPLGSRLVVDQDGNVVRQER
jgi:hypothetical protein